MSEAADRIFFVGGGRSDTQDVTPELVGTKAWNLMRMDRAGLRVPPAVVIGTGVCRAFHAAGGGRLPEDAAALVTAGVRRLEQATGKVFGGRRRPLLVSVRSGAPVSMPGMMASVLNVGLTTESVRAFIRASGNARLAWDAFRRLVQGYGEVVHGLAAAPFEAELARHLGAAGARTAGELDSAALRALAEGFLGVYRQLAGRPFPRDAHEQLAGAVEAVLRSWRSPRALEFRRLRGIDEALGTAVTIQAMVFGNQGSRSGSGVAFTRDPATGADELYVDFLADAQGEDVVAGRHALQDAGALERALPGAARELAEVRARLEAEFGDMQDFEFTVEEGVLYLLQSRPGTRTPWAAAHIAVDLVRAGVIDPGTALARLDGIDLERLERHRLAGTARTRPLAVATPASIGVAVGRAAFDTDQARALAARGEPVVLVRETASTADVAALAVADGVLTAAGGRTSHAAVVARELGAVCLVGCGTLSVDPGRRWCRLGDTRVGQGEFLSLDGDTGAVYAGRLACVRERPEAALAEIHRWRAAQRGAARG